ncbi:MAG: hypothetical protein ACYC0X_04840 [Pirellulaceae bacterium]
MLQTFVGIVSQQGIKAVCPEDPAAIRFLWRRVQRESRRTACFWSVIPNEAVELIESTLNLGLAHEARILIQQLARAFDFSCSLLRGTDYQTYRWPR